MLRKLLFVPALAGLVLLGGCFKTDDGSAPATIGGAVGTIGGALIDKYAPESVAKAVKDHCGIVVTAADWFGLRDKFPDATDAVAAICQSFKRVSSVRRGSTQTVTVLVRGVPVSGHYGP